MSNEKSVDMSLLYKKPFSMSGIIIGFVFSTYFLTVETIELSLLTYVIKENKPEIYREYLVFKSVAPIWKWWQLFTLLLLPIAVITAIVSLFQTVTKKATIKRHLLDIVTALNLFAIIYTIFIHLLPLEANLIKTASYDNARDLNFTHWTMFILNIIGFFIPIFQYKISKNDENFHPEKKRQ